MPRTLHNSSTVTRIVNEYRSTIDRNVLAFEIVGYVDSTIIIKKREDMEIIAYIHTAGHDEAWIRAVLETAVNNYLAGINDYKREKI